MVGKEVYLECVLNQVPRLLGQLDRNPFSSTYGCFDWLYWHDKITGFPNGHSQESMLVLSLLYGINDKENVYYKNEKIKQWAIAGLLYWANIQHKDGTYDEFYVNERQMGATAITLYAACKTFFIFKDEISFEDKKVILKSIRRCSALLSKHDETHILSNHQAQVILALFYAGKIIKKDFSKPINTKLKRILENQSKDGWFKEYSGADLGYLTTTISFLAEYYLVSNNKRLVEPLKKAIEFTSYFIYPDGSFGGTIGSRNTAHLWLSGFEIMNENYSLCRTFCNEAIKNISRGTILTPEKEDRYFSEQMYDYLNAYNNYSDIKSNYKLPYEKNDFMKFYNDSKIFVSKKKGKYTLINGKKAGLVKVFDIKNKKIIHSESGYVAVLDDNRVLISSYNDDSNLVELKNDHIKIKTQFKYSSFQKQSVIKSCGLNLFMYFVGLNVNISNWIKDKLIFVLISGKKLAPLYLERKIFFSGKIEDTLFNKGVKVRELVIVDDLKDIFVAYSKYFSFSELNTSSHKILKKEIIELNNENKLRINRSIN